MTASLLVRSFYSLFRGTASPAFLCSLAGELGYQSLALTDCNNLYGLWPFLEACGREEIRPIIGAEVTDHSSSLCCLVETRAGFANLCRLISRRQLLGSRSFNLGREAAACREGLIFLIREPALLQKLHARGATVAADLGRSPGKSYQRLCRLADKLNIPAPATMDSFLGQPADYPLHRLLRAISSRTPMSRLNPDELAPADAFPLSPARLENRFAIRPRALRDSELIAERASFRLPEKHLVMPPYPADHDKSHDEMLREKALQGAGRRYGLPLPGQVVERLDYELKIIKEMNFASYFLTVADIINKARYLRTKKPRLCGRGSGAASLVAYCLEITNVCPLKYGLDFDRFLNPGRLDPPDIDIDFAWDERPEIVKSILERFPTQAALVCNHNFFQAGGAVRETARAYGLPDGETSVFLKRLRNFLAMRNRSLDREALQELISGGKLSRTWREILTMAAQLTGLPSHLSLHPGGLVITPGGITCHAPLEKSGQGLPMTQWDKDGVEEAGLVKIDLLGNRSLAVIRDCIASIRKNLPSFTMDRQPEEDSATRALIARGGTMGCFYIESPSMRLLQQKAGTGDFRQLVIQSSLIRPAANEFIREYVRRLHGGGYRPLHPLLDEILAESFGIMVFQEDVSRIARSLAGFSAAEADALRKVISKKDKERDLHHYRRLFFEGAAGRGISPGVTEKIWKMVMSFAGYSFCKAHSASYARVSFQAAWLKAHYPAPFMAAVLSNEGGYYSTFAYVSEAKRLGLRVLPPEVNSSGINWRGEGNTIRTGLKAVSSLSLATMERIVDKRLEAPYSCLGDFMWRVAPAENEARALIKAGAFDELEPELNQSEQFWELCRCLKIKGRGQPFLFSELKTKPQSAGGDITTRLAPPAKMERLRRQFSVLGFLPGHHPLEFHRTGLTGTVRAGDLKKHAGKRVSAAGWLLCGKRSVTKHGDYMEFLTFEDETGILETVFFPRAYQTFSSLLQAGRPYLLTGLVEEELGAITLTVDAVKRLRSGSG